MASTPQPTINHKVVMVGQDLEIFGWRGTTPPPCARDVEDGRFSRALHPDRKRADIAKNAPPMQRGILAAGRVLGPRSRLTTAFAATGAGGRHRADALVILRGPQS